MPYNLNMENQKRPLLLARIVYINIIKNQEGISYSLFIQIVSSEHSHLWCILLEQVLLIGYVS